MKKRFVIYIILSVILILLLPIAMDWLIIGNSIPSNVANSDWVDFLGSYIGAILGAIVSLVGIIITIRYTNKQNWIERELQIRPYCTVRNVPKGKIAATTNLLGEIAFSYDSPEENKSNYHTIIYIKNIGLGPAVEFNFELEHEEKDNQRKTYQMPVQRDLHTWNHLVDVLQPGEEAALYMAIAFNFEEIEENDFLEMDDDFPHKFTVKTEVMQKYKNYKMLLHVNYQDLYQNHFYQRLVLSVNMYVSESGNKREAEHGCDVNLIEVTPPKKIVRLSRR